MKLGVYPINPLYITILPNRQEYKQLTHGKGKLVESSEAFYSPSEHKIYVRSPDQITTAVYDNVLMHEYIHWFLDETLDNAPLWFHEGMAMYYSGQFNFQTYYNFSRYRFMGYKISLNDMALQYPANRSYWEMFYLTSVFAINNLESRHNQEWQEFWNIVGLVYNRSAAKQTLKSDFIKVFNYSFHMSLYTYSKEFDKTLTRFGWQFPLVGINAIIFSLLPFVVFIAWLKSRRKMKAMPEQIPLADNDSDPEKDDSEAEESDPDESVTDETADNPSISL